MRTLSQYLEGLKEKCSDPTSVLIGVIYAPNYGLDKSCMGLIDVVFRILELPNPDFGVFGSPGPSVAAFASIMADDVVPLNATRCWPARPGSELTAARRFYSSVKAPKIGARSHS